MADDKKTEKKEESLNEIVARVVGEVMKATLPEVVALSLGARQQIDMAHAEKRHAEKLQAHEVCGECNLPKKACKGEHILAVVYPSHLPPQLARHFQGVFISGVRFRSPNKNTPIVCPRVSDIQNIVNAWAKAEEVLHYGHSKFIDGVEDGAPISARRAV